jgi:hypothetical protein
VQRKIWQPCPPVAAESRVSLNKFPHHFPRVQGGLIGRFFANREFFVGKAQKYLYVIATKFGKFRALLSILKKLFFFRTILLAPHKRLLTLFLLCVSVH